MPPRSPQPNRRAQSSRSGGTARPARSAGQSRSARSGTSSGASRRGPAVPEPRAAKAAPGRDRHANPGRVRPDRVRRAHGARRAAGRRPPTLGPVAAPPGVGHPHDRPARAPERLARHWRHVTATAAPGPAADHGAAAAQERAGAGATRHGPPGPRAQQLRSTTLLRQFGDLGVQRQRPPLRIRHRQSQRLHQHQPGRASPPDEPQRATAPGRSGHEQA